MPPPRQRACLMREGDHLLEPRQTLGGSRGKAERQLMKMMALPTYVAIGNRRDAHGRRRKCDDLRSRPETFERYQMLDEQIDLAHRLLGILHREDAHTLVADPERFRPRHDDSGAMRRQLAARCRPSFFI